MAVRAKQSSPPIYFISQCLGFPICTCLLRASCRINEMTYVLLLAFHLAHAGERLPVL